MVENDVLDAKRYFYRKRFIIESILEGKDVVTPDAGYDLTTLEGEKTILDKELDGREQKIIGKINKFKKSQKGTKTNTFK